MNILFYFSHPAQFHFSKNAIEELKRKGHRIDILAKTKDILTNLLEEKGWKYRNILSRQRGSSKVAICLSLLKRDIKVLHYAMHKKYDLMVGTDACLAHVGKLLRIPVITVLEDDYQVIKGLADLTYPFTTHILTPNVCRVGKWNHKKTGYDGYMKLAYLHPRRFFPDVRQIGHLRQNPYFLIRLSGLKAHHDFGIKGITEQDLETIIEKLSPRGTVYISSEKKLPERFQKYILKIPVSKMHHHLYFADMLICDSQSMAVEAAMLGTPSIRISSFSGKISVLEELEHTFKLTFGFLPENITLALQKIDTLLQYLDIKKEFRKRRIDMLHQKIDVTAFLTWFIEDYPNSAEIVKKNPEYPKTFVYLPHVRETVTPVHEFHRSVSRIIK